MTIIYREEKGTPLTADEIDGNFRDLDDRLAGVEGLQLGEGGIVGEAPDDGQAYVRKNKAWAPAEASGGSGLPPGAFVFVDRGDFDPNETYDNWNVVSYGGLHWYRRGGQGGGDYPAFAGSGAWGPLGFPAEAFGSESTTVIRHMDPLVEGQPLVIRRLHDVIVSIEARLDALDGGGSA